MDTPMLFSRFRFERLSELLGEPWGDLRIPGLLNLIDVVKPKRVLEIGSFKGVSTEVFLLHAEHVTAVDPWDDDHIFMAFHSRVSSYPHLTVARGRSPTAVPYGLYDFIYIDGDHSLDAVLADIGAARKTIKPVWIGGHDYGGVDTPDVARAVKYAFPNRVPQLFPDSSWLIRT